MGLPEDPTKRSNRMRRGAITILAIGLLLAAAPILARATDYQIDPSHTAVTFSVRHLMISNVRGEFEKTAGTISVNGTDPSSVKINVTIDASSINTRVDRRDAHLKSPDFLEVDKYPTITFKSTRVEAAGSGKWKVTGDLTLHGVTKEVVLDVTGPTPEITDPMGAKRVGASATASISRKDFGLTWNKALESGGVVVGDEVDIQIDVEAVETTKAAAAEHLGQAS
jgi:polyisoprenoid-binding protein YceI